ncbi:Hsp70 protein-domain-containing protein [Protomyces lactucae-debilis]|uniref:Hsp70 protein-domain-containing protein n=1 Tax=Protomyces lactucae-debilis TaxID=2754530 RepID=A0A1Y2FQ18_PROLT|nr:Hsp70 protein-domain-containing protein [Protomyces lactucae-debilis]ORY86091.1 Hsp70 protein-domain-containing protein [Protomyces lactucae-debilis]
MQFAQLAAPILLCLQAAQAAVLAIDYGTGWTKAALVKPGIPLEIVLTKDTKRKEQSVIAFKQQERLYGGDAAALAARYPEATFFNLKNLLGQTLTSEAAVRHAQLYPANKMQASSRGTVAFEVGDTSYTVEELVAMQLKNIRKNAELMASEKVKDAVLTVPPHFTQDQRLALIEAAQLAGLRPLELVTDGTAVIIDYAKARPFNASQMHLVYDMGSGSTSATLVRLSGISVKDTAKKNKTITYAQVLSLGAELNNGGNMLDQRLYEHLVSKFDELHSQQAGSKLATNPRGLARLMKEATKVKQILSANNEAMASVESLHGDVDFRYKVTRAVLEELTADLVPLVANPITEAFKAAGVTHEDVDSIIIHGGAARVPFIKTALASVAPEEKLARNVNSDEAAVMGAVFRGAGLSGQFRVKELVVSDQTAFDFQYSLDGKLFSLFPRGTAYGTERNVSLTGRTSDAELELVYSYNQQKAQQGFAKISLTGRQKAVESMPSECLKVEISATFKLDHSGIVRLSTVQAHCEYEEKPGMADKVKGWFGGKDSTSTTAAKGKKTEVPEVAKRVIKTAAISSTVQYSQGWTSDAQALQLSLAKIGKLDSLDSDRVARESARNSLEAHVYRVRDLLDSESFLTSSTPDEQSNLQKLAAEANEWMYGDGENASLEDLDKKRYGLSSIIDAITSRREEAAKRPESIDALQKQIDSARKFVKGQKVEIDKYATAKKEYDVKVAEQAVADAASSEAAEGEPAPAASTEEEDSLEDSAADASKTGSADPKESAKPKLEAPMEPLYDLVDFVPLEKLLDEKEAWLKAQTAEQAKLTATEDPVLLVRDLDSAKAEVSEEMMALIQKVTYKFQQRRTPPKKSKASKTKSSKPTATPKKAEEPVAGDSPLPADEPQAKEAVPEPEPEATPAAENVRDEL